MKRFWVDVRPFDKIKTVVAIESGAEAVLITKGLKKNVKEIGEIKTIAEDGDLKLNKDVMLIEITSVRDYPKILCWLRKGKMTIIKTKRLEILPLENLIAQNPNPKNLIIQVKNHKEAKTAINILEKGAGGIILTTDNLVEIKKTGEVMKMVEKIKLVKVKITTKLPLGLGDRAMIDTCTIMKRGQGMLAGNTSSGMLLVQADCIENKYTGKRAFKVNAGAIHAYIKLPMNKTKYLSELKIGQSVLVVDYKGNTQEAIIGRVKIERRPLLLVEGEYKKQKLSHILQNVETIHLIRPDGTSVDIGKLKVGDYILAYVEEPGRHFGMKVKETIIEK